MVNMSFRNSEEHHIETGDQDILKSEKVSEEKDSIEREKEFEVREKDLLDSPTWKHR
jgi:hypothetical protein